VNRRKFVLLGLLLSGTRIAATRRETRIGVLGLFRPLTLTVRSADERAITLRGDGRGCVIRGREEAIVGLERGALRVSSAAGVFTTAAVHIGGDAAGEAQVELGIPGRIVRTFRGTVNLAIGGGAIESVVSIDLETAVASVVAAEQRGATAFEALKAQAVAARSYFVAAPSRHRGFDFCDTTHCQFLREPPPADHPAARAAHDTGGLVLAYRGTAISALYSASCGGRTHSLTEAGFAVDAGYPYFSVDCAFCRQHAKAWATRLALNPDTQRLANEHSENARLAVGRRNGWSSVPGSTFEIARDGHALVVQGRGAGHGIGLCQVGAAGLAADDGALFTEILAHYYPGTALSGG
jgi:stage II sporulation protein D